MCGLETETVKYYLLIYPRFAAQRLNLLTSAAQVCGQELLVSTDNGSLYLLNAGARRSAVRTKKKKALDLLYLMVQAADPDVPTFARYKQSNLLKNCSFQAPTAMFDLLYLCNAGFFGFYVTSPILMMLITDHDSSVCGRRIQPPPPLFFYCFIMVLSYLFIYLFIHLPHTLTLC